ncbi:MAG TPA: YHYH protein [Candidatus Saccharimonadales bacterium]|nr:YHYH protein [Candidatus Saccharimonadales bacterium]
MDEQQAPEESSQIPEQPKSRGRLKNKKLWAVLLIILGLAIFFVWSTHHGKKAGETPKPGISQSTTLPAQGELKLDENKNYGDKYADGILPVGDGKYTTKGAKKGHVYVCSQYAKNLGNSQQEGAQTRGPWFTNDNKSYDINKKIAVKGNVSWPSSIQNILSGSKRNITTNDLPVHKTGIFPIPMNDPAYRYDRNPNAISSQNLMYELNADPSYGQPSCVSGEIGVMLSGVALFSGFDADGRDAGAWETQDSCQGHPQSSGEYHYHTLSSCIKDISVNKVIGFALDGFPITGPKVGEKNYLTTSDLDKCHGITSQVVLDGTKVIIYHYVMTQDFPYSISCFRGKAITPPGQKAKQPGGAQGVVSPPAL